MTAAAMQGPVSPAGPSGDLPPEHLVLGRAAGENFPVASRFLPSDLRSDLMALYGWARLVDELGDNHPGDRLAALDEVDRQLRLALGPGTTTGPGVTGTHPLVARMAATALRRQLPTEPLFDLVRANRQDQVKKRYETFDELVAYCRLSADPVGRTVLALFGAMTPERTAWSNSVCTALQLVEHWQDVAEDAIVGRVYLPSEDLARFGVTVGELVPPEADYTERSQRGAPGGSSAGCRALLAFEAARARRMLEAGTPLVADLRGRLRFAVAGFVAGGHAALDALAALDFDIYADNPRPAPRRLALHLVRTLMGQDRPRLARRGKRETGPGASRSGP
jgi:squalene synthase HpnC